MNPLIFITTHAPALLIIIPLLTAFVFALLDKVRPLVRNSLILFASLVVELVAIILARSVLLNGMRIYVMGSSTPVKVLTSVSVPVRIVFAVDAMSAFMVLLSTSIVLIAIVYSFSFMKEHTKLGKFYTLMMLMTVGMMGMELTGDIFTMFVFLEILSISSAALVSFYLLKEPIEAAFKYIVLSSLGALMVLIGIGVLYTQYDLLNMAALGRALKYTFVDKVALALMVTALAMKCGAVPMHMWVPDAYGEAPAPVSLAIIVASQTSLYALFRVLFTIFGPFSMVQVTSSALVLMGALSILLGVLLALKQTDLKRMIGFAAVAETGFIVMAMGVGLALTGTGSAYGMTALRGGIFHILNDALDLGLLFLVAGSIFYATGTYNLNRLGGLARNMKYTTLFFLIGMAAVSGLPPMNGFASKLLIYESVYAFNPILSILALLASLVMLATFVKVFHAVFMGPSLRRMQGVKEVPKSMLLSMLILSIIIILFGLFPNRVVEVLVSPAARALVERAAYIGGVLR